MAERHEVTARPPPRPVKAGSPRRPCANERLRAANRANAARSTGPRTRAGKAVVARNALRHGLSVPVLADASLAAEAAALVRQIAGEDASEPRREAALRIAEAQVDVLRIRRVRPNPADHAIPGPPSRPPRGCVDLSDFGRTNRISARPRRQRDLSAEARRAKADVGLGRT